MNNNIKKVIEGKGISVRKMSIDLDMGYSNMHRIVNNDDLANTQLRTLDLIARYLDVDIDELYNN